MPDYAATNALDARRPLPDFYWTGETEMNCLRQAIGETKRHAYAHHIQRLMVTGNFALLAGLEPQAVEEWYLLVYADAFEWVELPNTHGMALYADGMSDYCSGCAYDPAEKLGPKACPFNYLYWDFLLRNEKRLSGNPRMAMPYRTLAKMEAGRKREIATAAELFLDGLSQSTGRA
jgi:deoxyribodipyrimidine photolyase-related protein